MNIQFVTARKRSFWKRSTDLQVSIKNSRCWDCDVYLLRNTIVEGYSAVTPKLSSPVAWRIVFECNFSSTDVLRFEFGWITFAVCLLRLQIWWASSFSRETLNVRPQLVEDRWTWAFEDRVARQERRSGAFRMVMLSTFLTADQKHRKKLVLLWERLEMNYIEVR